MVITYTETRPAITEIQDILQKTGYENSLVQPIGEKGYSIKLSYLDENQHQELLGAIRGKFEKDGNKVLEDRLETIGPSVSAVLKKRVWTAGLVVILAIILYISYAFRKVSRPVQSWKYGISAVIALVHDVSITAGVFAILGRYYGVHVDIPFVVALLTILGYSVNDTIVVFDRIRENLIRRSANTFEAVANIAVNETMVRSLNTSLTVLLVLVALFFFGGASIHYFTLALIIGIGFGTYSSIFVASTILVVWEKWSRSRG